ncbi:esterase/lipase family protein [Geodermatophilus sp. CPCC 205506]|uniref:esterase/lipase family protein n=1 Tax=Geodermatophilus sp. CPCC 205506 TaxID=2936596 RepID=UPI003EEFA6CA
MRIVLPLPTRALDVAQTVHETAVTGLLTLVNSRPTRNGAAARQPTPAPHAPAAGSRTPVVLVHGFGGNASTWSLLERWLSAAGFPVSHATTYSPFARCVTDVARALVGDCHGAMERAGTDQVHLIGYSLGGVVVRYAVQELGLEPHVRTAVTVAAPHRGTLAARLGRGTVAAALTPGSGILEDLRRGARASSVRWVSYYSDRDLVVRPRSSRLDERALRATNVLVPGVGHLGIIRSPLFLTSVVHLLRHDGHPERTRPEVAA